MMDLRQTPYKFYELSIIAGARKSHIGKNQTDYRLKDYYHLSI